MTRLVVDSTCDLPADQMTALGIVMVPLQVHFGDESFKDKIEMDSEAFFDRLDTVNKLPTTSQPSPGAFIEAYEAIPGDEPIISIHIAEQLSGTVQSARLAAGQLKGRDIRVIDSGSVTRGAGLLAMVAAEAIQGWQGYRRHRGGGGGGQAAGAAGRHPRHSQVRDHGRSGEQGTGAIGGMLPRQAVDGDPRTGW